MSPQGVAKPRASLGALRRPELLGGGIFLWAVDLTHELGDPIKAGAAETRR
jgi:hypothetical protein